MSLVADYGYSSDSSKSNSDVDSENSEEISKTEPQSSKFILPKPIFGGGTDSPTTTNTNFCKTSSVFKNPFIEAENAKEALLQKHVKMVDSKDNVVVINGKKICWNYRKGRCRFGHNCKFAHDSDVQKTTDQINNEKQLQQIVVCQSQSTNQDLDKIKIDLSQNKQKRKRPGLTQGLVPGKKVMKHYQNQKI